MRKYYIYDGQIKKGPFDLEQLKSQSLSKESPIWYEGLQNWAMAEDVDELKYLFIPTTPPPFPKSFEKKVPLHDVLNSFADAEEFFPEPNKKSRLIPIVIFVIIAAIIIVTILIYNNGRKN